MDGLATRSNVVCSIGPLSVFFSELPDMKEGRDAAIMWNEEMAGVTAKISGPPWASAAPCRWSTPGLRSMSSTDAVGRLGLMGVTAGQHGSDPNFDPNAWKPFYARCEELGLPLFLHPTDALYTNRSMATTARCS